MSEISQSALSIHNVKQFVEVPAIIYQICKKFLETIILDVLHAMRTSRLTFNLESVIFIELRDTAER